MKRVIDLNNSWKYLVHDISKNESFKDFYRDNFDDSSWETVNVPHDSSIVSEFSETNASGPRGGYAKTTLCYYTKTFNVEKADLDKDFVVEFEGVYMNSTVYINGEKLGTYPYGYTAFRYNLTQHIRLGENRIAVLVNNEIQPASRWYTGTGIYRKVKLYVLEKVSFDFDNLIVKTPVICKEYAKIDIDFSFFNSDKFSRHGDIDLNILDAEKNIVASFSGSRSVATNSKYPLSWSVNLPKPILWCNENPYLYTCKIDFTENGELIDSQETKFGVREIKFTANEGFIINGKKEFLKGVCLHHDNGLIGASAEKEAFRRKILAVKKMGANAIRTSHNPEAKDFLDLCDEYGMYVMEEAFDEWTLGKRPGVFGKVFMRQPIFAYASYFENWAEKDLSAMIKRDRNHACIVMWSVGNEIEELRHVEGEKLVQDLRNIVYKHDCTRPVTVACNGLEAINKTFSPDIVDVCGYNYAESFYEKDHERRANRVIIGSETATVTAFEARGKYEKFLEMQPCEKTTFNLIAQTDAEHQSSEELAKSFVKARMDRGENSWKLHVQNPFVAGIFIWTGIDYIGEPTPKVWPSISSYFAPIDRALQPKDAFYFYKSIWSDEDVLHILPHWNLPEKEGKTVPVWCFTNCDEVEIFVNGKSFGKKTLDKKENFHLEWDEVFYEKGEIKAVGTRNGKEIVEKVKTTGSSKSVLLELERTTAELESLVYAKVSITDENGLTVPNSEENIEFSCNENLSFIASDNGNPEFSNFNSKVLPSFSGIATAVFRAKKTGTGQIEVKFNNSYNETIIRNINIEIGDSYET